MCFQSTQGLHTLLTILLSLKLTTYLNSNQIPSIARSIPTFGLLTSHAPTPTEATVLLVVTNSEQPTTIATHHNPLLEIHNNEKQPRLKPLNSKQNWPLPDLSHLVRVFYLSWLHRFYYRTHPLKPPHPMAPPCCRNVCSDSFRCAGRIKKNNKTRG